MTFSPSSPNQFVKALLAIVFALYPAALIAADANRTANAVILNEEAVSNLHLTTAEAEEAHFEETIFALGRIQVFPGNSAVASTRISGRVLSLRVKADDFVEKGEELCRIESRLPGDPPPIVTLTAPLSGHVARLTVQPGQPVTPETSLMEIVNLAEVHAVAHVPEHLASRLKRGLKAHIRLPGYPQDVFDAQLEHLGVVADSAAGTLEAVFHLANPDLKLRPGMKAEFSIVTGQREEVMSVPREAVQGDGIQQFVYVQDYELKHTYLKTPVVLGVQNDRFVEIKSGLLPGDLVVTRGAYALVFAGKGNTSLKEALDAAHGHAHAEDGSELTEDKAKAVSNNNGVPNEERGLVFTPPAIFFAGTTGVLLLLLIALSNALRKRTNT